MQHLITEKRPPNPLQQSCGRLALHSKWEFDIIPSALQMLRIAISIQLSAISSRSIWAAIAAAVVVTAAAHMGHAQQWKPAPDAEQSGIRKEILSSLQDVQRQYGRDAVMMEGQLLGQAIRSGSIVDAVISIPGIEERDGRRYLVFKLDTGIIYNDRELTTAARPIRLWMDVVEPSLRQFQTLNLPADGVGLIVAYTHKEYVDEADLRAHLHESSGEPESVTFYVLSSDVAELTANRSTAQQVIDRATVLFNGVPTHLVVEASGASH
jgi:hypothetical protein